MRSKIWLFILAFILVVAVGGLGFAWSYGLFDTSVNNAGSQIENSSNTSSGDLTEALALARKAQEVLNQMPGYKCVYLRDELIGLEMQQNYLNLTIQHKPFSVCMEWIEPKSKKGRKAIFVEGKNDNKMLVKQLVLKLTLDPEESIKRKESRHTIREAGLKNMVDRFVAAWEKEIHLNETATRYSDADVKVMVSGKEVVYPCRCVETVHPMETKGKYTFQRTLVFFDKTNHWPVRMEGYDWPTSNSGEGRLAEKYIYINVQPLPNPKPDDFSL